jgi:hypothetical protein
MVTLLGAPLGQLAKRLDDDATQTDLRALLRCSSSYDKPLTLRFDRLARFADGPEALFSRCPDSRVGVVLCHRLE